MDKRTGQLFFINGRFFEDVLIGDEISIWDNKLVGITDEIRAVLKEE